MDNTAARNKVKNILNALRVFQEVDSILEVAIQADGQLKEIKDYIAAQTEVRDEINKDVETARTRMAAALQEISKAIHKANADAADMVSKAQQSVTDADTERERELTVLSNAHIMAKDELVSEIRSLEDRIKELKSEEGYLINSINSIKGQVNGLHVVEEG